MIKRTWFILLFIFLYTLYFTQNYILYYNEANDAEYYVNTGNYRQGIKILTALEKEFKRLKPKDYFYLGLSYYYENDSIRGFQNIETSIKQLLFETEKLGRLAGKFGGKLISENAMSKLIKAQEEFILLRDSVLIKKSIQDSVHYYFQLDSASNFGRHDDNIEGRLRIQQAYLTFLKREGIPDVYLYGSPYLFISMHPANEKIFSEYKVFLLDQVKHGKLCPLFYATWVDSQADDNGGTSVYGTLLPVKKINKKKINRNRKKIGLSVYCRNCFCTHPNYKRFNTEL